MRIMLKLKKGKKEKHGDKNECVCSKVVATTWLNIDHHTSGSPMSQDGRPKEAEKYDLLVEKNRVATRRKTGV